ncbi:MAG TPA: substrate-binding domain-containing protein [Gammaproteobacteria bacterium]|nr:substrate-binding domain-containing protein [Gammaproteobacteria bacterium]
MYMSKRSIGAILIVLVFSAPVFGKQSLSIPGTEAFTPLLVDLAQAYNASQSELKVHIPEPVGSRGGIKEVASGKSSLAAVSRPLKEREREQKLAYRPFAMSQIVFVINPKVTGVERLTKDQILAIYSGEITNWREVGGPDHKIYPITRDAGSTLKALVKGFPEFGALENKVAKQSFNSQESVDLVTEYEYTITYAPLGLVKGSGLKVVEVEGVSSAESNLWNSGTQVPLVYGLVHRTDPPEEVLKFLRFLATPEAHKVMHKHGARPVDVLAVEGAY